MFHRGQLTPYNSYIDPTTNPAGLKTYPEDVTVANDGTVIASNLASGEGQSGSISTWIGGPNGGTFVGNFQMTNDNYGGFITVKKNGTVYYDDFDAPSGFGAIWSLSCPAGACGPQTQVQVACCIGVGGMAIDATGDLLLSDPSHGADTFELPNPNPSTFGFAGTSYGYGHRRSRSSLVRGRLRSELRRRILVS